MNQPRDPTAKRPATGSLKAMLVSAGLSAAEAEAFLTRIRGELLSFSLTDPEEIRRIVDEYVNTLVIDEKGEKGKQDQGKLKSQIFQMVVAYLIGVVAGEPTTALTTALWDEIIKPTFLKNFNVPKLPPAVIVPEKWEEGCIIMDWIISDYKAKISFSKVAHLLEPVAKQTLEHREHRYGISDQRTAFSLDALAVCLTLQRRYSEAVRLRRTAVKIEHIRYGTYDRRTAAAESNLAVSLAGQGRTREAYQYVQRSLKVIKWAYGENSVPVACIATNAYEMLRSQRILPKDAFGVVVTDKQFSDLASVMTLRKIIIIWLDSIKEMLEVLKEESEAKK